MLNRIILLASMLSTSSVALAEVKASQRHVIMLFGGTDMVYGQYLFSIKNDAGEAVQAEFPVMLAREKEDWFPRQGVLPKDVRLGEGGAEQIIIDQEFKSGDTFVVFNFTVPASLGEAEITLEAPYDIRSLMVMTPKENQTISISSEDMEYKANQPFMQKSYDQLTTEQVQQGQTLKIRVTGVSEGRGRHWWIGSIFGVVLLAAGGLFAWRQKPKPTEEDIVVEGTV